MARFTCTSCDAGFLSAASLANVKDKACPRCAARLETVDAASGSQVLADRVGRLIVRREVARAQARVDSERWADDGGHVGAAL